MSAEIVQPLIIDTDCGVDDTMAILLALSRHQKDWSLQAITCCRGVTNVDQVASNVLRILNYVGMREIPVYKGSEKPILDNSSYETDFHGMDGLGNASSSLPLSPEQAVQDDHASLGLIQHATKTPEVTLLTIGPLTNVALAHRLQPKFSSYLKRLVIMGGNIEGLGNETPLAEFNVYVDPEAAEIVLREFQCPITVYPWETCLQQPIPWPWFNEWASDTTRVGSLIQQVTCMSQNMDRDSYQKEGFLIPDLLAAACCLYPKLIVTKTMKAHGLAVELSGKYSRGLLVLDRRNQTRKESDEKSDVNFITEVDMDALLGVLRSVTKDDWIRKSD